MVNVNVNPNKTVGKIKPMHAVNNGPVKANFDLYKEAGIPFARNHDAAFCSSYGGEHTVDVHAIFPDFSKDAEKEESYDFTCTDEYLKMIMSAGTKIFYRLGSKIEHECKKYGTLPPADFNKWAVICEHIIRHYNEGWANGFNMNIEYWEIWNEPDLDAEDAEDKRTWGGTYEQFFDLYEITAKHLKKNFPDIKVGGPAIANPWGIKDGSFCDRFFKRVTEHNIPLDFFSWHAYGCKRGHIMHCIEATEGLLKKYNITNIESILNEWNYIENWSDKFDKSLEQIRSIKGAAFTTAVMCICQNGSVDMLMYYDARPSNFNGMFDMYSYKPLKGYYPFKFFNELYKLGTQIECESDCEDVYAISAKDENGGLATLLAYFTENDDADNETVNINFGESNEKFAVYLLDKEKDAEKIFEFSGNGVGIEMKTNTVLFIKKIQ